MDVLEQLIPVFTFIAGLVGAAVLERRRDERQAKISLAGADLAAAREDARYAREFERDTLLEVENAINALGLVSGELNFQVNQWVLSGEALSDYRASDDLSERERAANLELNRLVGRLRTVELHDATRHLRTMMAVAAHPRATDHDSMMTSWEQADVAGTIAQAMIGERLRELIYGDAGPRRQLGS